MRAAVALALAAVPAAARGDANVTVTLTPAGEMLAQGLGLQSADELIARVNDKITSYYQTANIPTLMVAFADTTAFADRDLGVGYAMEPGQAFVGAVAAGAIDDNATFKSSKDKSVASGQVYNIAVVAGANLAGWGHPDWSVFANGFYEPLSFNALDGHLLSTGAHVQYRIVHGEGVGDVRWIGLDATTGVEYARWSMGIAAPIAYKFTVNGAGTASRNLTLTSTGALALEANAISVPIEITSGLRFGRLVATYAGVGTDITVGTSTLTASLDGDMTITSDGTNVGHVTITASGDESPTALTVHALAGVEVDVPHFQIFMQAMVAPSITALALGLRGAFH